MRKKCNVPATTLSGGGPVDSDGKTAGAAVARVGRWLGPVLGGLVLLLPAGDALPPAALRLAALTILMATWWMTEAVPVAATALVPLALFPLAGIAPATKVAPNYGHDLIWLFFGGFQIAFAIERWGLHRRMALSLIGLFGTRADRLVLGFMLATGLLSMWLVNTSTTLMMLPVGVAVASALEGEEPGPFGGALMLGIAYSASIGGLGTLVGTAPNGIFAGIARDRGIVVDFAEWLAFAGPLALVMIGLLWLYLTRAAFRVERAAAPMGRIESLHAERGPWTQGERRVAVVFALTVAAWILRGPLLAGVAPGLSDATVAIAATLALYLTPTRGADGRRTTLLTWDDSRQTPWHILILFGGGFALADGFKDTGLSAWLGEGLAGVAGGLPTAVVVLLTVLLVTFLTEVTSNTATATVLLPVIGSLAVALQLPQTLLMVPATLAASCAFMLPVATPPNAIVYGTGRVTLQEMARVGFWINLGTAVVITAWTMAFGHWVQ